MNKKDVVYKAKFHTIEYYSTIKWDGIHNIDKL